MWKKLVAGVAGLGLSAGVAGAQDAPSASPIVSAPANDAGLLKDIDTWRGREFQWPPEAAAQSRFWGSAELLLGNTTGANVRPLVTTGPVPPGRARNSLGVAGTPGQPDTTNLFGGEKMLDDWRAGLRAEVGMWLDDERTWGASARFYSLFSTSEQFTGIGDGTNIIYLVRPVPPASVGNLAGRQPSYVGFPGVFTGSVATTAQTTFTGGDLNLRHVLFAGRRFQLQALAGYRQMHLGDELGIAFTVTPTPEGAGTPPFFSARQGEDRISTRNNFYGPNIGTIGTITAGRWSLEGLTSVALGVNSSDLDFSLVPDGFLTNPATSGQVNYFSVIAEGGVRAGFRVTEHAMLTVGYTGIYWSNVRRAQEQYSLEPRPTGGTTHIFANLLSLGAEIRY